MKNVNPLKALNQLLSILCVGAIFFIASCGSDDEPTPDPTTIQFSAATATVDENSADAVTLTVSLSEASNIAGSFTIAIASADATYGDDYTTTPDGTSGSINVTVAEGDQNVTLSVSVTDNEDFTGDKTVTFTLTSVEGVVLDGNAALTLTIADNELMPTDISALRTQYSMTGEATIEGPAVIEGVVTSARDNTTGQNLFIQDATGGIVLRFTEDNTDFDMGEAIRVDIAGGLLSAFRGLMQIDMLELTAVTERGMGTLPDAEDVTILELLSDDFQGKIVRLSDVAIDGADGTVTFGGGLDIVDIDGNEAGSFIRNDAAFNGDVIPTGTGTVVGIASAFNDVAQIDLRTAADVSFSEVASIALDASGITSFGSVENGMTSASQSYTLTGTDLFGDVTVNAPNSYEISSDDITFSGGLTITVADAEAGATIHVRFAPTSGTNGAIDGTVGNSSFGAVGQTVAVTGEETGNGSAGMPTDLFFSEYVEGSSSNKYLEIFNGTGASIDLADYEIKRFNNGGTDASSSTYPLSGMLADGAVVVLANSAADIYSGTVYDATDVNGATFYNGDDVVVLYKVSSSADVDIIGQLGCDPGSNWSDGDHSTGNKTLRRKSSVIAGVTASPTGECSETSFTTLTTEWDVFDQDTADGLGSHTLN